MLKWRIHFDSIPQDLIIPLAFEEFDCVKTLYVASTKLDIILENLSIHFLLNDQLKEESVSLYGTAKDLCFQLVAF